MLVQTKTEADILLCCEVHSEAVRFLYKGTELTVLPEPEMHAGSCCIQNYDVRRHSPDCETETNDFKLILMS